MINTRRRLTRNIQIAVVFATLAAAFLCNSAEAQDADAKITVDDAPLITSQPAVRQGGEWLVPLRAIASALSVSIQSAKEPDTITLRHANGVEYSFNSRTGEIRNRYVLIGRIPPNPAQLHGMNDELMIPLAGIVALFGVSAEEDPARNAIVIRSNRDGSASAVYHSGPSAGPNFQMIGLNYNFGLTTDGRQYGQIASFEGQSLMGGVKLQGNLETTRVPAQSLFEVAQASLRAEWSPRNALLFGDQSTYSGLDALTVSVRGLGYEGQIGRFSTYLYGGLGRGSTAAVLGTSGINKYDTTVGGFSLRRRSRTWEMGLAGNSFSGPTRNGTTAGTVFSNSRKRNQFKLQTIFGKFSGYSGARSVDGPGYGLAIADTFNPAKRLSLTALGEHYSENFLTARDETRFSGQTSGALGASFRPLAPVSLTGGLLDRVSVGKPGHSPGYNYGSQFAMGHKAPVLLGYLRNVNWDTIASVGAPSGASAEGGFKMTQYSVSVPHLNSYSFASYYSEFRTGPSLVRDFTMFATKNTHLGQFGAHDQIQFHQTHRYGIDWLVKSRIRDSQIQFGIDRVESVSSKHTLLPKVSIRLPFPGGQSMQLKYTAEPDNYLFQFELTGPIVRRREVLTGNRGDNLVVRPSEVRGHIYFDTDNNGRYDESVDKPIDDLTVWLDGNVRVVTDAHGIFRFDQVSPGAHRLKTDLSGVPADLAMVDNVERTIAVTPYQDNVYNFRVLRMGRILGKVTYFDYSADAANPIERPLPDARLLIGPGLDSYTEANGAFIAGDLVPGEYKIQLDPNSIPDGYISKPDSITIAVSPGRSDESPHFLLLRAPRAVIEKQLPVQELKP